MLALSTKYAITALLELAKNSESDFTRVQALSIAADVPGPYLSKIMRVLAAKNIIESKKGSTGGVRLIKRRPALTYLDVCVALDDPIVLTRCLLSKESCNKGSPCPMHESWKKTKSHLIEFLRHAYIE